MDNKELNKYKKSLNLALDALDFYGNPENYHAIGIFPDRPSGGFADDFSWTNHPYYHRKMPGRLARKVLKKIQKTLNNKLTNNTNCYTF